MASRNLPPQGAKVLVDDVIYFAEPMFSDGRVAQAVDIVTAQGVAYFSSAGNQARQSYEDEFRGVNVLTNAGKNLNGGKSTIRRFHDFDPGPGVSILQPVVLESDGEAGYTIVSFQWDQPHLSATTYARLKAGQDPALAKGATSDLDLVFFDYKGHVVPLCPPGVSRGITCQITGDRNIGGDAVDLGILYSAKKVAAQRFYVGFVVSGGPDPVHVKYVWNVQQGNFSVVGVRYEERVRVRSPERSGRDLGRCGLVVCHGAVQHQRSRAAERHADTQDRSEPVRSGLPQRLFVGRQHPDLSGQVRQSTGHAGAPFQPERDRSGRR